MVVKIGLFDKGTGNALALTVEHVLDDFIDIANQAPALPVAEDTAESTIETSHAKDIKLGLVRCSAFGFYYTDDLQALQDAGAELIEIDP